MVGRVEGSVEEEEERKRRVKRRVNLESKGRQVTRQAPKIAAPSWMLDQSMHFIMSTVFGDLLVVEIWLKDGRKGQDIH